MDIKPVRCRIPIILRSRRKTQVWLANEIGWSKQQLNDYINFRYMMRIDTAALIARILDVSTDDLFEWEWLGE